LRASADGRILGHEETTMDDSSERYPWVGTTDERFTLALVLDVGEVLARHGYDAPTGATLVDLTAGIYRALHPSRPTPIHQLSDCQAHPATTDR
jgi:hypothetical protein